MNRQNSLIIGACGLLLTFIFWLLMPQFRMLISALILLYLLIFCGVLFSRGGGGMLANRINGLVYTRSFLKNKPVMLSRIVGLIQQHDYAAAEQELLALVGEHPDMQDIVIMLGQLYLDNLRNYAGAEKVAADYLCRRSKGRPGDLNVVNLYVDACLEQGKNAEAMVRLDYELEHGGYATSDYKALSTRREALL